jgi:DNA-binding IclR family transcriptional regulator
VKNNFHQTEAPPATIQSVTKALSLLTHVRTGGSSLTELAHAAHIPVPTAYRMLATLQQARYVLREDDGRFVPGPAMYEIVFRLDAEGFVRGQAKIAVDRIRDEVGETASFVVSIGRGMRRAVLVAQSNHPVHRHLRVGLTLPTIAGASGHVLIAFGDTTAELAAIRWVDGQATAPSGTVFTRPSLLAECERIRRAGFCYSSGTADGQAWGIAAPVYANGMLIGAVAVSAPMSRRTDAQVRTARESVLANAASLTARLTLNAEAVSPPVRRGRHHGRELGA